MRYSAKRVFACWLRRITPIALPLLVASCADSFAPSAIEDHVSEQKVSLLGRRTGESVSASELNVLSHNLQLTSASGVPLTVLGQNTSTSNGAPPLDTYEVEFWAVRGVEKTVQVNYLTNVNNTEQFLRFTVPENGLALRPDGTVIEVGDSVLITLQIDASSVHTHFSPAGLIFNEETPAELTIWYGGFLNEDTALPDFWYGEDATADEWWRLVSEHNTDSRWVNTYVLHFSDYAVSW